jgi:hypothetical protein
LRRNREEEDEREISIFTRRRPLHQPLTNLFNSLILQRSPIDPQPRHLRLFLLDHRRRNERNMVSFKVDVEAKSETAQRFGGGSVDGKREGK